MALIAPRAALLRTSGPSGLSAPSRFGVLSSSATRRSSANSSSWQTLRILPAMFFTARLSSSSSCATRVNVLGSSSLRALDVSRVDAHATRFDTVSYDHVLSQNLKVMDATAVALCRENDIPIVVFSIREKGNVARVLSGEDTQTIVTKDS